MGFRLGPLGRGFGRLGASPSNPFAPAFQYNFTQQNTLPYWLSYSGPSLATLFDNVGGQSRLTYKPHNLVVNSTTVGGSNWADGHGGTGTATVVTAGQTDPNGGTTAFRVQANRGASDTNADYSLLRGTLGSAPISGPTWLRSIWIKSNTGSSQILTLDYNAAASGVVTATTSWQRLYILVVGSTTFFDIGTRGGVGATQSIDVLVWQPQMEVVTYQTTPSTYNPTTSAAYYGPRFDYDPVTLAAKGLLIEEARTNVNTNSQLLTDVSYTTLDLTPSASGLTSPNGVTNAQTLTNGVANSSHAIYKAGTFVTTSGTSYTVSTYAKSGTNDFIQLLFSGSAFSGSLFANFNLATGSVGNKAVGVTATVTSIGGGWYRCSVSAAATSSITTDGPHIWFIESDINSYAPTYVGTGKTITVFGLQLEAGSFPSSYIPTAASAVARSADIPSSTNGTALACKAWILEVGGLQASTAATLLGINTGIGIGVTAGNALTTAYGGAQTTGNTATWTGTNRGGIAFDATPRVSIDLNGGAVTTAANSTSAPTALYFGNTNNGASGFLNGYLRKASGYAGLPDPILVSKDASGAPL